MMGSAGLLSLYLTSHPFVFYGRATLNGLLLQENSLMILRARSAAGALLPLPTGLDRLTLAKCLFYRSLPDMSEKIHLKKKISRMIFAVALLNCILISVFIYLFPVIYTAILESRNSV